MSRQARGLFEHDIALMRLLTGAALCGRRRADQVLLAQPRQDHRGAAERGDRHPVHHRAVQGAARARQAHAAHERSALRSAQRTPGQAVFGSHGSGLLCLCARMYEEDSTVMLCASDNVRKGWGV